MCTQKMRAISYTWAEKITFSPKPDRQTYRRTDIGVYRVASLLIKNTTLITVKLKISDGQTNIDQYRVAALRILQNIKLEQDFYLLC